MQQSCWKRSTHSPDQDSYAVRLPCLLCIDGRKLITECRIPLYKTATQGPSERAKQADPEIPHLASNEIEALTILTQAKCLSSPYLIDSMNRQQTDGWVPGGYIHYIVMEMLPGVTVCDHYCLMERKERDELREAFKKAWM